MENDGGAGAHMGAKPCFQEAHERCSGWRQACTTKRPLKESVLEKVNDLGQQGKARQPESRQRWVGWGIGGAHLLTKVVLHPERAESPVAATEHPFSAGW